MNLTFLEASPYLKGNTEAYLERRGIKEDDLFQEHNLREYLGTLNPVDRVTFLVLATENGTPARKREALAYLVDFWRDAGPAWKAISEVLGNIQAPGAWAEFARTIATDDPEKASEWARSLSEKARTTITEALGDHIPDPLKEPLAEKRAPLPPEMMTRVHRIRLEAAVNTPQEALDRMTPYEAFRDPAMRPRVLQWVYRLTHNPPEVRVIFDALQRTLSTTRRMIEAYDLPAGLPGLFDESAPRMSDASWETILKRTRNLQKATQKWNQSPNPVFGGLSPIAVCAGPGPLESRLLDAFLKLVEERSPADLKAFLQDFLDEKEGEKSRREAIIAEREAVAQSRMKVEAKTAPTASKHEGKRERHRPRRR